MKTLLRVLTNKIVVVGIIVLLQLIFMVTVLWNLSLNYQFIYAFFTVISILVVIYVLNRNDNSVYRLAWTIVILAVPPIGAIIYLLFGGKKVPKKLRERITDAYANDAFVPTDSEHIIQTIDETKPQWTRLVKYVIDASHFPIYENTRSVYIPSGEEKFELMKEALREAKSFIFLEYFIIKEGKIWTEIRDILAQKVKEGVDVRLLYDDWGCALFRELQDECDAIGIQAIAFNPMIARLAVQMNNRNHRKICVVDGRYGFVGGMNLADEYANINSKFGHWKDTAVMIEGEAVHSLTLMFMQFWRYYTDRIEDPSDYKYHFDFEPHQYSGYVLPFSDAPTDSFDLGLDVHMYLITNARRYIYIQTPYLIIGDELIGALKMAARSGVDVRIIVPHVPDKKIVNQVTKSNYLELLENGVRIFEYEPGFVHSKTVIVDDEIAMVGTTNMDFRSYFLHYECSLLFFQESVIEACYKDSIETIENKSIEITLEDARAVPFVIQVFRSIARVFSGLM
ncbi:cardiolipin synthase [Erysipelothrix sp. HDW6A]|uniref:cardiolipin synthase n=1 Tax=Erysipelothrix sp. HDW6A TaxID=2714928 RepID=UPI001408BF65|nr:cardiolipin synthase [Erysipelothrix sp. HDW6A]QIK57114.1 cardiolipin synthase [Erysipelothrix sp. HDW6A]